MLGHCLLKTVVADEKTDGRNGTKPSLAWPTTAALPHRDFRKKIWPKNTLQIFARDMCLASYEMPIGRSRSGLYVILIQTGLCARLAVCKWDAPSSPPSLRPKPPPGSSELWSDALYTAMVSFAEQFQQAEQQKRKQVLLSLLPDAPRLTWLTT